MVFMVSFIYYFNYLNSKVVSVVVSDTVHPRKANCENLNSVMDLGSLFHTGDSQHPALAWGTVTLNNPEVTFLC